MNWHRFGGNSFLKGFSRIVHAVPPGADHAMCRVGRKAYSGERATIGIAAKKGDPMCKNCLRALELEKRLHELKNTPPGGPAFRLGEGRIAQGEASRRRAEIKNLKSNHQEEP